MTNDYSNFAEGDSGIPIPGQSVKLWNELQAKQKAEANKPVELVSVSPAEILAEITGSALAIGRKKSNSASDRVAGLELARRAVMDQIAIQPGQDMETDNV